MKVGIDLGTTRSAVGIIEAGTPTLMMNNAGDRLTPSVVHYAEDGEVLVGKPALGKIKSEPERVIRNAKREMGRDHSFDIDGVDPSPVDVSAEILNKLKSDAEEFVDDDITGAYITVPAYFTVDQKADTRQAAERAGFDEVDLLHEPTAAAISYGYDRERSEIVFVYDFGGGTLDISVLEIDGNNFSMLATSGDTNLGGDDFTEALVDMLAEEFEADEGVDPRADNDVRGGLREVAENAKIDLSGREKTEINAPLLGIIGDTNVGITERVITRDEFEDEVADLLDRAMEPIDEALEKARMDVDDLDRVLMVGGSCQIPAIGRRLEERFGFEPSKASDLDWAVAQGAAIVADSEEEGPGDGGNKYTCPVCGYDTNTFEDFSDHLKTHDDGDGDTVECYYCDETFDTEDDRNLHIAESHPGKTTEETDPGPIVKTKILGRSLGTDLAGGRMDILLSHDTEIPENGTAEATARYTTVRDDQTRLPVHVYQGEDTENLEDNVQLADWYVENIPEMPKGEAIVEVTFEIDRDSVLSVDAELVSADGDIDKEDLGDLDISGGRQASQTTSNEEKATGDD